MSHECPLAVRSKLMDQRVRKHARRTWSVGEAVRSWWSDRNWIGGHRQNERYGQVLRRVATKDRVHGTAQLELDASADWKPVQLEKAWSNMLIRPKFKHQVSGCVLHSLQWCDRCLRQAGQC